MCDHCHWYVLRTTYGREKKAYDYLTSKGIKAYYPTIDVVKEIDGKRSKVTVSRLPNLFFALLTAQRIFAIKTRRTKPPAAISQDYLLGGCAFGASG